MQCKPMASCGKNKTWLKVQEQCKETITSSATPCSSPVHISANNLLLWFTSQFFFFLCLRHWGLAPRRPRKTVWWGAGPRRTKRWDIYSVSFMAECHGNADHMLCVHMEAIERAKPDVTSLQAANRGLPLPPQYKLYTITGFLPSCGSVILLVFSLLTAQWSTCLNLLCQMSTFVVYTAYVRPNEP